jgi:hypothetical protein
MKFEVSVFVLLATASLACMEEGPTSSSAQLLDAGWSFGFCIGPCISELAISGDVLTLRVSDRQRNVIAENRGRLTPQGSARLSAIAASLPADLAEQYGCPDCADGGASWVTVVRDGNSRRTQYEHGNPPPPLQAADEFLSTLITALRECRGISDMTLLAGCTAVASNLSAHPALRSVRFRPTPSASRFSVPPRSALGPPALLPN